VAAGLRQPGSHRPELRCRRRSAALFLRDRPSWHALALAFEPPEEIRVFGDYPRRPDAVVLLLAGRA